MNSPNRPAGSEPYIVAMANQADRSNHPTHYIVIASIVILGALVYSLFGVRQFVEGSERIRRMNAERHSVDRLITQIETLNSNTPDLRELYPSAALMPNTLRRAVEESFADNPEDKAQPSYFNVSEVDQKPTETTRNLLNTAIVKVSVQGNRVIDIDDILKLIETALRVDESDMMFLGNIEIRTDTHGWRLSALEFRRYNFNRGR